MTFVHRLVPAFWVEATLAKGSVAAVSCASQCEAQELGIHQRGTRVEFASWCPKITYIISGANRGVKSHFPIEYTLANSHLAR
jgi:hypothetical protein